MLQIRVQLVPHGVGQPQTIGAAVIGQLGRGDDGLHRYAAAAWDDEVLTTPMVVSVDHDRGAGLWALVGTVLETIAGGRAADDLGQHTLDRLEQALLDMQGTSIPREETRR